MAKRVVDVHAHAFDEKIAIKATENLHTYYGIEPAADGRLIHLIESAKENNIDKLVLCATATKPKQVEMINDYVSGLIGEHVIGLGTLHPDYDNISGEIDRIIDLGLSGLKFHPIFQGFKIDEDKAMKMFEAIGDKLPVLIHIGDKNSDAASPERLARVMDVFPEITFIKPKVAREIIRAHGADKILFGTDYPLSNHKYEMKCLDKLKLTEEEYEMIYWKNAYKLFGIKE